MIVQLIKSYLSRFDFVRKCYARLLKIFVNVHAYRFQRVLSQSNIQNIINGPYTYFNLNCLLESNKVLFEKIAPNIYTQIINNIRKKDKICVAFLVYTSSMWACDELYRLFEADPIFDPVILVRTEFASRPEIKNDLYNSTLDYYTSHGYHVIGVEDYEKYKNAWEIVGNPDIIFHQTPYELNTGFNIKLVPLKSLNCYVPYTIAIDNSLKRFGASVGYKLSWVVFCETLISQHIFDENTANAHAVFSGYPKMDTFYDYKKQITSSIWKIADNVCINNITKIIYAPHHSIYQTTIQFSTFPNNYLFMYQYAKSHPTTTSWIIKPHPALKMQTILNGIFKDEKEYDDYMDKWDALPNAKTVRDGPYFDIFKTSDGMILDSVSFLSEYQYTGKPLLFLTRPEQKFNEYGEELVNVLYTAPGNDMKAIEEFIESVLIERKDYMKPLRKEFFEKYLDYKKYNGMLASDFIYNYINKHLTEGDKTNEPEA